MAKLRVYQLANKYEIPSKDFVVPNKHGWKTVMLKNDGRNIHTEKETKDEFLPQFIIESINEVLTI